MSKDTILFEGVKASQLTKRELLEQVYSALEDRGYNAIDQMVGYLTSGDPSYITSHNNARNMIMKVDRDDLLEEILRSYLGKEKEDQE
ncbi:IreB family regulatory phosphoprotein [Mobilibacterium timonense]|uniref:IreB family regulatory phosphoprotein n=1 Tax=Mobilibacterium timonense TaxID=1871012 RepID=UPI0019683278|nr:IreB family regulatory phosphoprotein [Mobilibacterium timonense]MBM6991008.1 IreB family regulatory phosphoprotein [Mobilibacterium timonense]